MRVRFGGLVLALALGALPSAAEECAPWPGEPARLSAHRGEAASSRRWRALRIEELSRRAAGLESLAPIESHLLWRRVLCLDPWNAEAKAGEERSRPLRVHRPRAAAAGLRTAPRDPWSGLSAPVSVAGSKRVASVAPRREVSESAQSRRLDLVEGLLFAVDSLLRSARYQEALDSLIHARSSLDQLPDDAGADDTRARMEVLAATAQLGLGREEAARERLLRALAADPALALDPATTSADLMRVMRDAKRNTDSRQ